MTHLEVYYTFECDYCEAGMITDRGVSAIVGGTIYCENCGEDNVVESINRYTGE